MKIGELAYRTGLTTKTIRYYEDIELIPEPARSENNYRDYPESAVERLKFIRDSQATGLTLTEIASILELRQEGDGTCEHVAELLDRHLEQLDRHIAELREARTQLAAMADRAKALDPENCTDPIRCQTIAVDADRLSVPEPLHHHG